MQSIMSVRVEKQTRPVKWQTLLTVCWWFHACGDSVYSNSRFGSSPALMCRLDSAPRGMCFPLSTYVARSDLESVFSSSLRLEIYCTHHTSATRLVTGFPRNSRVLKPSWESNLESRSVKIMRATVPSLWALKLQLLALLLQVSKVDEYVFMSVCVSVFHLDQTVSGCCPGPSCSRWRDTGLLSSDLQNTKNLQFSNFIQLHSVFS